MRPTKEEKKILNALLHKLLRLRDTECCLRCSKTEALQLSHIYPKGRERKLEFDYDNVKLLCVGCHLFWWHKNPIEAWEWLKTVVSKDRLERLKRITQSRDKYSFDFKIIKMLLEQKIKEYARNK